MQTVGFCHNREFIYTWKSNFFRFCLVINQNFINFAHVKVIFMFDTTKITLFYLISKYLALNNLHTFNFICNIRVKQCRATRKVIMADACMSGGLRQKQSGNHHFYHKKSDVVLFLSSRTKEFSMESKKMRNGYFTTYLAKGLRGTADFDRNRMVTAKEIYTYVSKKVKTVCNNKQHPVMWGNFRDNLVMIDWKH